MDIKVAIIEPVGGHGGMNYYDFGLCKGLSDAEVDVVLYSCDETAIVVKADFEVRHAFSGIYGEAPVWIRGLRYVSGSFKTAFSTLIEGRTICHFHFFHVGPLQAMNILLAKFLRRCVVITAHDVESFVDKLEVPLLSRWAYRQANMIIAHNRVSKQELITHIGAKEEKISVIPHGNYLHAIRPLPAQDSARKDLNIAQHAKVILFFGQIKDVKGLDLLLEAMPDVIKSHPDAVLLIAGKPWKRGFSAYTSLMKNLDISKHCVTHIRYIPDEDVPLYYSSADIVVLPYRRIYQSGVVLMAMSYGKAVLVSDLQGMTEIVKAGENGYVFRQGNKNDLIQQLCIALDDSIRREHFAEQGYKHVRDYYDWQVIGQKTKQLYVSQLS